MTHLLYLTALLLVGLYCEGRVYARGVKDGSRSKIAHCPSAWVVGEFKSKGITKITKIEPEKPSPSTL